MSVACEAGPEEVASATEKPRCKGRLATASPLGADACCGSAPAVSSAASPPTGTEGATGTVSPSPLPSADATASFSFVAAAASLPKGADVSPQDRKSVV